MKNSLLLKNNLEILKQSTDITNVKYNNNELINYSTIESNEYIVKGKLNEKYVSLVTEDISNEEEILNNLITQSLNIDNSDDSSLATESIIENNPAIFKSYLNEIVSFSKEYTSKLLNQHNLIKTIEFYYLEEENSKEIINKNIHSTDSHYKYTYYYNIMIEHENKIYEDNYKLISTEIDLKEIEKELNVLIHNLLKRINQVKITSGKKTLLLKNIVVSKILEPLISGFSEKNINQKQSPYTDKFNEQIFSNLITIIEDPTNKEFVGKTLFDTEGTKTYKKSIVDGGKFITKLYDNQTAKVNNTSSTGNSDGVHNLYIKPTKEEIKIDENTLVITDVIGTHAGINHITGTISLEARAYQIINEEFQAIESLIITTDIFELLSNVEKVGNDLKFISKEVGSPSLLINDINITVA